MKEEPSEENDEDDEPASKRLCTYLLGDVEILGVEQGHSSSELTQFQREPVWETDPLVWWRQNEARFPRLASLAKDFLAIPATEVPCERVFSAAGLTISRLRASLDGDTADKLLFLNKNARSLFQTEGLSQVLEEEPLPLIETTVRLPRVQCEESEASPTPPSIEANLSDQEGGEEPLAAPLAPQPCTPSTSARAQVPPTPVARPVYRPSPRCTRQKMKAATRLFRKRKNPWRK